MAESIQPAAVPESAFAAQAEQPPTPEELFAAHVAMIREAAVGWWVWQKAQDTPTVRSNEAVREAVRQAQCDYDDSDMCKFMAAWKATDDYRVEATIGSGDATTKTLYEADGGSRYRIKNTGATPNTEVIGIGSDYYVKAADGSWWKQTAAKDAPLPNQGTAITFAEPMKSPTSTQTAYKKISTEGCGSLTCFKYQIIEPGNAVTSKYMWFDNSDYQLRGIQVVNDAGSPEYEATISYPSLDISRPSPVKDAAPGQQVLPGQTQSTVLPATGG